MPYERTTSYGRRERPLAGDGAMVDLPLQVVSSRPPISLNSGY